MDVSWDHYRTFISVLKMGSLSAAARSIGLTQPTVGRHIDAMESQFGTLFIRSQSGFAPTELATRLSAYAESMENNVAALVREASLKKSTNSGTVRVTASEMVGAEVLPPMLSRLHGLYPNIKIELVLTDETENLLTREADIAIRMFEPQQQALVAKKLGFIDVGAFAHQNYLSKRGTPKRLEDLEKHSIIGFDTENEFIRSFDERLGVFKRSSFSLRTDSNIAQFSAIRAGFGIGFCQVGLAARDPNLKRLLAKQLTFKLPTWIVMHENLRANPIGVLVFNHLRDDLQKYVNE